MSISPEALAAWLGDLRQARFGLRDDTGATLDCLKIAPDPAGGYLGVNHTMKDGVFHLRLTQSTDFINWRYLATLDTHASQGELLPLSNGTFVLAYEHDEPNSTFVRVRRYTSREDLIRGKFAMETTLGRTLAPTAEGTPSIERATRDALTLRFHYYRNGDVDRAAKGTLRVDSWTTEIDNGLNAAVEAYNVRGNIGGRTKFFLGGKPWYLQEGQLGKNDWASWRLFLLDGACRKALLLPLQTPGGSLSFANPFVGVFGQTVVMTAFMPSEGNARGEAGAMLCIKDGKEAPR
ncbi:MAG: hypothetical protein QM758_04665 [Armatimonas sp.]